jgi:hypothetical protein
MPSLGVQPSGACLIGDFDLDAKVEESVHCLLIGGSDVGRRDEPHLATALNQLPNGILDQPDTLQLDERAKQIDPIGRRHFSDYLMAYLGLATPVDKQSPCREASQGTERKGHRLRRRRADRDGPQEVLRIGNPISGQDATLAVLGQLGHDMVDNGDLSGKSVLALPWDRSKRTLGDLLEVASEKIMRFTEVNFTTLDQVICR